MGHAVKKKVSANTLQTNSILPAILSAALQEARSLRLVMTKQARAAHWVYQTQKSRTSPSIESLHTLKASSQYGKLWGLPNQSP